MNKQFTGVVLSTKMQKTIVVSVERKFRHPRYQKVVIRNKKFKAHNELEGITVGDYVIIKEVAPMSKEKCFAVVSKTSKEQVS